MKPDYFFIVFLGRPGASAPSLSSRLAVRSVPMAPARCAVCLPASWRMGSPSLSCLALASFMLLYTPLWAQPDTTKPVEIIQQDLDGDNQIFIENALEDNGAEDGNFEFDTQFEDQQVYRNGQLNINTVTEEELSALQLLSALQIQALVEYRQKVGRIVSPFELINIPTWDENTLRALMPYFQIEPPAAFKPMPWKSLFKYGRRQLFMRWQRTLEPQLGYSDEATPSTTYLGSPDRLYARLRHTYRDRLSIGLTMEKDPGEPFFKGQNKQGFDYYSGHIYLKQPVKYVQDLVLGDYLIQMGQGLISWSGFGLRKGSATTRVRRLTQPIKAYTSVNEFAFLRGAATRLKFDRVSVIAFGSYRGRDGGLVNTDTLDETEFALSALVETGLHRTDTEMSKRNTLGELTAGGSVQYAGDLFRVGINTIYSRFSTAILPGDDPYQRYRFTGQSLLNASIDYAFLYRGLQVYGETAISDNGSVATINGLSTTLDEKLELALVYRNYSKGYQTIYGNAFGESSGVQNEQGLYIGMATGLFKRTRLSAYVDVYKAPFLRYLTDAPSRGVDYLARLDYNPARNLQMYVQFRHETKQRNSSDPDAALDYLKADQRTSLRFHVAYNPSSNWSLRSRVEWAWHERDEAVKGFAAYQDIIYSPTKLPMKFYLRYAIFDADYDARIYTFENDVLYAFSVPALSGRGTRWYGMISYQATRRLSFWFRVAQTWYADRTELGSGGDLINGRHKTEVKVQMRWGF
jgi:hypothetical protein